MENETVLNAGVMFQFAAHVYQNSTKYTSEVQNLCRSLCMESVSTFRASSDKYNPSDIVDMVRKCQSLLPLVTSHMAIVPLVYQVYRNSLVQQTKFHVIYARMSC